MADSWKVKVAYGWRDKMPAEVHRAYEKLDELRNPFGGPKQPDPIAAFVTITNAVSSEVIDSGMTCLIRESPADQLIMAPLRAAMHFSATLCRPHLDFVSFVFLNFTLRPIHPEARNRQEVQRCENSIAAIHWFSDAVAKCVNPANLEESCEWVIISCERVASVEEEADK